VTQGMDLVKGETLLLQAVREGTRMQLQLLARDGGLLRALTASDGETAAPQPGQTAGIAARPAADDAAVQALSRLAAEGQGVGKALMALLDALGSTRMSGVQSGIPLQAGTSAAANGAQAQTQINTGVLLQSDIQAQSGAAAQTGGMPGQAGGTPPQAGVPAQASGTPGQDSAPAQPEVYPRRQARPHSRTGPGHRQARPRRVRRRGYSLTFRFSRTYMRRQKPTLHRTARRRRQPLRRSKRTARRCRRHSRPPPNRRCRPAGPGIKPCRPGRTP